MHEYDLPLMSLTGLVTVESDTEVCESPGAFLMACYILTSNFTIEDGVPVDIAIQDIDTSGEQTQTEIRIYIYAQIVQCQSMYVAT